MKMRMIVVMMVLALAGTAAAAVTLTSPNGGEKWLMNGKYTISWSGTMPSGGNPNVRLVLRRFSTQQNVGVIKSGLTLNSHSYQWTVGHLETGGPVKDGNDYFVRLVKAGNGEVLDESDHVFAIYSLPAYNVTFTPGTLPPGTFVEDIKVSSPSQGANFKPGAWISLKWDKSNIGDYPSVALGVYKADRTTFVGTIDGQTDPKKPNTGSYQAVVFNALYVVGHQYAIRVATPDDKHKGFSGVFRIVPLENAPVTEELGAGIHWRELSKSEESSFPGCLNTIGQGAFNPPVGYPVGYWNHLDDPAGPCWAYYGAIYRTFIKFEKLQTGEDIVKAELRLTVLQGTQQNLYLQLLETSNENGPASPVAVINNWTVGNQVSVDVTQAVRLWCTGQKSNFGFVLKGPNEAFNHNNLKAISYIGLPKLVLTKNILK
jgi:hypothetical protein